MNIRTAVLCVAASAAGSVMPSGASALTYWYVGQPAVRSDDLMVNTGFLTVDEDVLRAQPDRFSVDRWDDYVLYDSLILASDFAFHRNHLDEWHSVPQYLTFDGGQLVDWYFATDGDRINYFYYVGRGGDGADMMWMEDPYTLYKPFLERLGYKEGTRAYEHLACGGFVSGYGIDNCYEDLWVLDYLAIGEGIWTTDYREHALLLQSAYAQAFANPPGSIYGIAPIPVPPAGALLIGGIVLAAGLRRRAQRLAAG